MKQGALFIASGLLETQKEEVSSAAELLGFTLVSEWPKEEWVTLLYRAPDNRRHVTGQPKSGRAGLRPFILL